MQAISINEFHAPRWDTPYTTPKGLTSTLGRAILNSSDLDSYGLFILIGIGALISYVVFYNVVICIAMAKLSCKLSLPRCESQTWSNIIVESCLISWEQVPNFNVWHFQGKISADNPKKEHLESITLQDCMLSDGIWEDFWCSDSA